MPKGLVCTTCTGDGWWLGIDKAHGHEATDIELTYTPVSQAYDHCYNLSLFCCIAAFAYQYWALPCGFQLFHAHDWIGLEVLKIRLVTAFWSLAGF